MNNREVYHQFTVLYFPDTGKWELSEELDDGIFLSETNERLEGTVWTAEDVANDSAALSSLNAMFGTYESEPEKQEQEED